MVHQMLSVQTIYLTITKKCALSNISVTWSMIACAKIFWITVWSKDYSTVATTIEVTSSMDKTAKETVMVTNLAMN